MGREEESCVSGGAVDSKLRGGDERGALESSLSVWKEAERR